MSALPEVVGIVSRVVPWGEVEEAQLRLPAQSLDDLQRIHHALQRRRKPGIIINEAEVY